ncbi:MAG TPA: glutaredoxin family protein [Burkholderiales bacterium]|jgi:glutaredoxin|nr:glutaredoxin family protein [Burkholderiales bacterium]
MKFRAPLAVLLCAAASAALAQQLYRWTDEKGRVHITDTPPPASARNVQRKSGAGNVAEAQQGFELSQAVRNFPVTLYTAPSCKEYCVAARALLNKRGVPFTEVQVADDASRQELKAASGGDTVPTLVVGHSVHSGYSPDSYSALLDSARYPKPGASPPRAQAAPPDPDEPKPEPAPTGPYAPKPRGY